MTSRCAAAAVALCAAGCAAPDGERGPPASVAPSPVLPDSRCRLQPADWAWFRDFWFDVARAEIQPGDAEKIDDIAAILRRQPALCVAIDGTTRERGSDLGRQRIVNVREALLRAGVGAERILTGDVGNPGLRHTQRVEVLIGPRGRHAE
jgi:outer membrane protein OmpA-like peptidoglycan-associated protein